MGILISAAPVVKYGEIILTLKMPAVMNVDFERIYVSKENFDHEIVSKLHGYRLAADFEWSALELDDIEELIDFVNSPLPKYLNVGGRYFDASIEAFEKPTDALPRDNCKLSLRGKKILSEYPNPDMWYTGYLMFDLPICIHRS